MKRCLGLALALTGLVACTTETKTKEGAVNKKAEARIKLLTVAPGHFHAYLVQNRMYPQLSPDVNVYAPEGPELDAHLKKIDSFNAREKAPTAWKTTVYRGDDFLEKMRLKLLSTDKCIRSR